MADKFFLDIAAAFPFVAMVIVYGGREHKYLAWLRLPRMLSCWRVWVWYKKSQARPYLVCSSAHTAVVS